MKLWDYQEKGVTKLAEKLAAGTRKVVMQLATGGGKTIMFSAISSRYIEKSIDKSVLIVVHRKELLQQTRRTLFNAFGISAQIIVAGQKHIPTHTNGTIESPAGTRIKVYVAMIETVVRRKHFLFNNNVGLLIIDEAHIHTFNKVHDYFTEQFIVGFTATPLSASKKFPMKNFYQDIVCGVDIKELIELNKQYPDKGLCQNITWAPRDAVSRASLTIKGNDFDAAAMAEKFAKPRFINNTVEAYIKRAKGTKAIVFNVNIDHSKQVNAAFITAGFNSRHLDSEMLDTERTNILSWFAATPGAILNNVGILTAGFDEPSIETVIFNRATLSLSLWLQCTGRGSRPYPSKDFFTIIDMGGNAAEYGDWSESHNWEHIFFNPKKKKEGGVGSVKICPECDAIVAVSTKTCKFCGCLFPEKEQSIEGELSDFIVITKGINVTELIQSNREKKLYFPFFQIGNDIAATAKKTVPKMTDAHAEFILAQYNLLAKEWCNTSGKNFNKWHQARAKDHLFTELQKHFKYWTPATPEPTPEPKQPPTMAYQNFAATDFFSLQPLQ